MLSITIERARLFDRSRALAATEERNRLAREIHDTLAQGLAGITLQLESADAMLETGDDMDKVQEAINLALSLARTGLEDARRSVLDLRAAPLERHSFGEALQSLVDRANAGGSPELFCDTPGELASLPIRVETALYRIAQEALSNIVQHANAAHAWLRLEATSESASLIVEDDGVGFDPDRIPKGRFGLVGMRERVKMLGGRLDLSSGANQGTRLIVTLPLD